MYHWSKKDQSRHPTAFLHLGLVFPLYAGKDSETLQKANGGKPVYAFFGNRAMTEQLIRYHVCMMIERREYVPTTDLAVA
jgi:hypothetical protein